MNELDWLADQRPEVPGADEETTAYARTALLAYAYGRGDEQVPDEPLAPVFEERRPRQVAPAPHAGRRRSGSRRRRTGILATAAVAGVAIIVGAGALPSGDNGPAQQLTKHIGATDAEAAPLVKLIKSIQQQPAPSGDATLVLRSHHFPAGKHDFTGADLYFDDGRYFYGQTLDELEKYGADLGEGVPKQEREAAIAAIGLPDATARKGMIDATWAGGHQPTPEEAAAQLKASEKIFAEKERLRKKDGYKLPPPASQLTIDNNRIWMGVMDTLISGAGDAKVRAGDMKLLATMPLVKVTDHGATLDITNTDFSDAYQETLVVDGQTGVIQKMIGGTTGKEPSVIVDYDIKRVDAADYVSDTKQ